MPWKGGYWAGWRFKTNPMSGNFFIDGAIPPNLITGFLQTGCGAHSIFLGQVRDESGTVTAIDYTAYEDMALDKMHEIRETIFARHPLTCLHVYHSLGRVAAGEISLFVLASAPHRRAAIDACAETVEAIKASLPVWGREIFEQGQSRWKWST